MKQFKLAAVVLVAVVLVVMFQRAGTTSHSPLAIALQGPWAATSKSMDSGTYRIAIVADLDKHSKIAEAKKPTFRSYLKEGILRKVSSEAWAVDWLPEADAELISQHNEAGRGMELSELVVFNNKLFTFDDRSGIVFEISAKREAIPRYVLMEGDGNSSKGQKTEWATVKDNVLYTGSFGKEYVNEAGDVTSRNNLWISKISAEGIVSHEDWTEQYNKIRATTNSVHPAYMIIETICWSPVNRKWFVLPRRVSTEAYDEKLDEKRGSNIIVTCDEYFSSCSKFSVGTITPERGFSSAKFVPGTHDKIMVALKSEENDAEGTQSTYIAVFDLEGKVLLDETLIGSNKYEGLEFI